MYTSLRNLKDMGHHLPYSTNVTCQPTGVNERCFNPARQASTWLAYSGGIEGSVDSGGWLYTGW